MLDFTAIRKSELALDAWIGREGLTTADLPRLTNKMVDTMLGLIADCADADVTFEPNDQDAYDSFASSNAEVYIPWTLGHVIVHATASAEEAAAMAAEMARGVPARGGRSRYEVPWQSVRTVEQCRKRLEESRRMRLASLEMWPAEPHLDNIYQVHETLPPMNALTRFVMGLMHDDSHLGQIAEAVKQAKRLRTE